MEAKRVIEIEYNNDEKYFNKYKKIVGISVINYLAKYISEERNAVRVNYSDISKLIRYDKRLKYNIFKYLGTIEDTIKQKLIDNTIFNKNFKVSLDNNWDFSSLYELNKNQKNYYSINKILEELFKLEIISIDEKNNLNLVIDLRNKIMHFNLIYVNFEWFKQKIKELKELLPQEYRSGYIDTINKTKKGFDSVLDLLIEEVK